MATLSATYLDDLGRIRLELVDPLPRVSYRVDRSADGGASWQPVRGAQNMGTLSTTIVDDFEYTPNVENRYRLMAPSFYDSFQRLYPTGGALVVEGVPGSYASTPDAAALDITGDIDLRVDLIADNWPPLANSTLIAKYDDETINRGYRLDVLTTGQLRFTWSTDGSNNFSLTSTIPVPATLGQRIAVRVAFDAVNASLGKTAQFYTATSMLGSWVPLGSLVSSPGATSIYANTSPLEVGGRLGATRDPFAGRIFEAQVRSSINGTIVARPEFIDETAGTTSFVDSTGKTWTVGDEAEIVEFAPVAGFDWGTADTGQAWNLGSSSSGFSMYVANGDGVIQSDAPAGEIAEMMTDSIPGTTDAEVTWSATYPDPPTLLDNSVEWVVGLRASGWDAYESNLRMRPAANGYVVELRIAKYIDDEWTLLASTGGLLGSWERDVPWHVRFRVQGSTLSARAWEEGSNEPANWNLTVTDTDLVTGDAVFVRGYKGETNAYQQFFGPITAYALPVTATDTIAVTPVQPGVWLKSLTYPLFNRELECVDWEELERTSRTAFFDIKGRHEILGIADVGSSATFTLTFISYSKAENRAIVALLTYGGLMLLQPPGDDEDEECPTAYSGTPEGYVMVGDSVQSRTVYGKPMWLWTVTFTRVAPSDADAILPTTITWVQLWDLIGPEGTWQTVWETWETWQELWLTNGNPLTFGGNA